MHMHFALRYVYALYTRRNLYPRDRGRVVQNNSGLARIFILLLKLFGEGLC